MRSANESTSHLSERKNQSSIDHKNRFENNPTRNALRRSSSICLFRDELTLLISYFKQFFRKWIANNFGRSESWLEERHDLLTKLISISWMWNRRMMVQIKPKISLGFPSTMSSAPILSRRTCKKKNTKFYSHDTKQLGWIIFIAGNGEKSRMTTQNSSNSFRKTVRGHKCTKYLRTRCYLLSTDKLCAT